MVLGTTETIQKLSNFSTSDGDWNLSLQEDAKVELAICNMKRISELTALTMFCFDSNKRMILDKTNAHTLTYFPEDVLEEIETSNGLTLIENTNGVIHFLFPLIQDEVQNIFAVGFVFSKEKRKLTEMVLSAVEKSGLLQNWISGLSNNGSWTLNLCMPY